MLAWLSVWSKVQTCIWSSWCHCHSLSLASVKSRLVLPFWYRLTRVVLEEGPLNGCVCVCVLCSVTPGVISGPPQWQSRRESTGRAVSDSPLPRPPPMIRSVSSQSPPSLPPKQPRPLSHHSALRNDPIQSDLIDPPTSVPPDPSDRDRFVGPSSTSAVFSGMTSYPSPPNQAVASIPRRSVSATPSGPQSHPPPLPPRDAVLTNEKTESDDNSSNECAVCLERPPDCVLYMCGHMCVCYNCALDICQSADASCPICRRPIIDIIKIFRS